MTTWTFIWVLLYPQADGTMNWEVREKENLSYVGCTTERKKINAVIGSDSPIHQRIYCSDNSHDRNWYISRTLGSYNNNRTETLQ